MTGSQDFSLYLAFGRRGLILSLSLRPAFGASYLAFLTGLSFEELTREQPKQKLRRMILTHSLLFILGFSALFTLMGGFGHPHWPIPGGSPGHHPHRGRHPGHPLRLFISGVFSFAFLQQEKKLHLRSKPLGYLGSFLVGVTFAAGWTPCVGPLLSSMLLYASTAENLRSGILLLFFYSLGLGIPFFACSLALNSFLSVFQKTADTWVSSRSGWSLLVIVGVLLLVNSFEFLNEILGQWFPSLSLP